MLQHRAAEVRALAAVSFLRENGVEPIVIKGFAAGRLYPEGKYRVSVDTDLAVSEKDFPHALELATSKLAAGMAIDLHRELRHLDSMPWSKLMEDSIEVDVAGGSLRILRPEDHLRVLCVHWLTDGGSNRERLWDIYYGIQNRGPDFDWDRFLNSVGPKRRMWLVCAAGAAGKYLGLRLEGTPLADAVDQLPEWFVRTIENEWSDPVGLRPMEETVGNRKLLVLQLKRRLNPNPISATVQMNGDFAARTRVFYQIGNALARIVPSYKRISPILRAK